MKALILAVLLPLSASAQVLNAARFDDFSHLVHAGFGIDGPMQLEVGYVHSFSKPVVVGARLVLPFVPEAIDFELAVLTQVALRHSSGWGIAPRFELALRNLKTRTAKITDGSLRIDFMGGYYGERFSIVGEAEWEKPFITHVQVYQTNRSGLFPGGGGLFRFGLAGGVRFFSGTEVTLRLGVVRSEKFAEIDMLPLYAQLGINHSF